MELTTECCAQIVALINAGRTQQDVAQQLNISQPNVGRNISRYRSTYSLQTRPLSYDTS